MSVIPFDYYIIPYVQEGKLLPLYLPIIPVKLSINHKIVSKKIKCVLDSGSDFNLFPAEFGAQLGLQIMKGKRKKHTGIGNMTIQAYGHPVKLFVNGYSITTEVDFAYQSTIPLLGRHGFFRFFKQVTFNEKALRVELEY